MPEITLSWRAKNALGTATMSDLRTRLRVAAGAPVLLGAALEAVREQLVSAGGSFEIVAVDDRSRDGTLEPLERAPNDEVKRRPAFVVRKTRDEPRVPR